MNSLSDLLITAQSQRDDLWEQRFLGALPSSSIYVMNKVPQMDPNGQWPYLWITDRADKASQQPSQQENLKALMAWCVQEGLGLVFNPQKMSPDYIFNYGMVWHFFYKGCFFERRSAVFHNQKLDLKGSQSKSVDELTLPIQVRKILKEFTQSHNVLNLQICQIDHQDGSWDLALDIDSLKPDSEEEQQNLLEALSWFLPPHYSLMALRRNQVKNWSPL